MKAFYLYLVVWSLLIGGVFPPMCAGQELPSFSDAINIEPDWTYISGDPNWVRTDTVDNIWYDKHYAIGNQQHLVVGDLMFVLEVTQSWDVHAFDGYIIRCLRLDTGMELWSVYDNEFTWEDYSYTSIGGEMLYDEHTHTVSMLGFRSMDPESVLEEDFNLYSFVVKKTYDANSGALLSTVMADEDDARVRRNRAYPLVVREVNGGQYLKYFAEDMYMDGTVHNILRVYATGFESGSIDTVPLFEYDYDTKITDDYTVTPFSFSPANYFTIGHDRLVHIVQNRLPNGDSSIRDVRFVVIDISDLSNIAIIKDIDIGDYMPSSQVEGSHFVQLSSNGNSLCVVQNYKDQDGEYYTWMAHFDTDGELINYYDPMSYDGEKLIATYSGIDKDGVLHMLNAAPELNKKFYQQYSPDGGIESFFEFTETDPDLGVSSRLIDVLPDGDLLMKITIFYKLEGEVIDRRYGVLARFDAEKLGIVSSVTDQDDNNIIAISPNPVTDMLNIDLEGRDDVDQISIWTIDGRLIDTRIIGQLNNSALQLDVSTYENGLYTLVPSSGGQKVDQQRFVVYR